MASSRAGKPLGHLLAFVLHQARIRDNGPLPIATLRHGVDDSEARSLIRLKSERRLRSRTSGGASRLIWR